MLKEEFLKLTGAPSFPDEAFDKVNNAYMELQNMDKQEFCKLYKSQPYEIMDRLVDGICSLRQQAGFYKSQVNVFAEKLIDNADGIDSDTYEKATLAYGQANTIKYKVRKGYSLTENEQDYLQRNLR